MLDIDSTNDAVHGRQEGRFVHGYYGHYCFRPLYIICDERALFAQLRSATRIPPLGCPGRWAASSNGSGSGGLVSRSWVRAVSAYAREEVLAWCGDNGVGYANRLARNSRLVKRIGPELARARADGERRSRSVRRFTQFP